MRELNETSQITLVTHDAKGEMHLDEVSSGLARMYICIFRPSAQTGSLPFTCMFSSLVSCLVRLYGHSE